MERISIFILAALGIINPAVPMAKSKTTAKVHPAVSVATAKLQAKPILFFNTTGISPELDYTTGKIIKSGKSDEFTNFCVEYNKMQKEIFAKKDKALQEWYEMSTKWSKGQITEKDKDFAFKKYELISAEVNNEQEILSANVNHANEGIYKKIKTIKESIAKRLNACAVLDYHDHGSLFLIDPAYDITQEVFDTLNKEYKESQSKIKTCTHSCELHCPSKCDTHCAKTH